jgi:ABC-type nitrate/sulfonate/bicarbonate transport system substrate-binding protein
VSAEPIHLQLRWHHQFQFAGYYAALEKGYYKDAGLDVIIHEGTPEKKPVQEVLQGHAQYGETARPTANYCWNGCAARRWSPWLRYTSIPLPC